MRSLRNIRIRFKKPQLRKFTYFPIIAYDNSYVTIKWEVRYCVFIRINNKIGFRKSKGELFTLITNGTTYKITSFGFWGIKTFELKPNVKLIEKKEIKGIRLKNEIRELKQKK
jgi:hypothetical protein